MRNQVLNNKSIKKTFSQEVVKKWLIKINQQQQNQNKNSYNPKLKSLNNLTNNQIWFELQR